VTCGDADNFTIMHSGDSQQSTDAAKARCNAPVDLYFCHAGLNIKWPINQVQAALTVLSHANELGHETRWTYTRIYDERLESVDGPIYYPRVKTTVAAWGERVDPYGYFSVDAYDQLEAEGYDSMSGVSIDAAGYVKHIHDGDHVAYDYIDFGSGASECELRIATANAGGRIELRLDEPTGTIIGQTDPLTPTGGWTQWGSVSCTVDPALAKGKHRLCLVFKKDDGLGVCNVDWLRFHRAVEIEAENHDEVLGISTDAAGYIKNIHNGDHAGYDYVDFGAGVNLCEFRLATVNAGGVAKLRLDSPTGTLVGQTDPLTSTGGWTQWDTVAFPLDPGLAQGRHTLYLVFEKQDGVGICNVDWFRPSLKLEAEDTGAYFGITVNPVGGYIENIHNGDYAYYEGVDLGDGIYKLGVVASSVNSGQIEVRLDSITGPLIGTLQIDSTGGWTNWEETTARMGANSGVHDIVLVFVGGSGYGLFNIDSLKIYR
jgi:hypothetical protein